MKQRMVIGMEEMDIVEGLREKDMSVLHAAIEQYRS
ncbi:RNA polymerase sigma-70 factor, ECF subfamily domain protein [Bacillus clarus]|uniref:RNA polymerase sigma-70 factor, ECF subfamily domain protein n=1 Tax=Bacillus clarus TaxID=2338372 RepID=A0A090ZAW8_9BACI|nr:RNA polymerase sigma-70 factor, ECF subfamily domain protein [Bacillus clarus]